MFAVDIRFDLLGEPAISPATLAANGYCGSAVCLSVGRDTCSTLYPALKKNTCRVVFDAVVLVLVRHTYVE